MTPALETYLAEVEAAEAAMTPGPWRLKPFDEDQTPILADDESNPLIATVSVGEGRAHGHANAHGIALLRNRVKALCGMVWAQDKALDCCRQALRDENCCFPDDPCEACIGLAAVALIAKGQGAGEGRESQNEPLKTNE